MVESEQALLNRKRVGWTLFRPFKATYMIPREWFQDSGLYHLNRWRLNGLEPAILPAEIPIPELQVREILKTRSNRGVPFESMLVPGLDHKLVHMDKP